LIINQNTAPKEQQTCKNHPLLIINQNRASKEEQTCKSLNTSPKKERGKNKANPQPPPPSLEMAFT
jgi:hypothetical protein